MKKHLITSLIGILAIFASCSKENKIDQECAPTIIHFVGREEATETKTSFGDKNLETGLYPILWSDTDQVGVTVNASAAYETASVTPSAEGLHATFSASLSLPDAPFKIQAVSPEWSIVSFDGVKSVTLNIPALQIPSANSPDAYAQILVAETELDETPEGTVSMQFHHATAYGCLSLKNLPAEAGTIRSVDIVASVPISGKWTYNLSTGVLSEYIPSNVITIQTDRSSQLYFGCAPADLEGQTLKIRLNTENGNYERTVTLPAGRSFKAGTVAKFTVDMSASTAQKSIRMLSIGNSYTDDANEYLWRVFNAVGYTTNILVNHSIGGCTLQQHVTYHKTSQARYVFHKNTSGSWTTKSSQLLQYALDNEPYDYVVLHQLCTYSGVGSSYSPWLEQLIDIVRESCPQAKLIWYPSWAFQSDYSGSSFETYYNRDQMKMYNDVVDVTLNIVLPTRAFGDSIPADAAVQDLRTSYMGDTITRDGYHMSYNIGRYLIALLWVRQISGLPIDGVAWTPGYTYGPNDIPAIKDAVEKAHMAPFEITTSAYAPLPPDPSVPGVILPDDVVWGESANIPEGVNWE